MQRLCGYPASRNLRELYAVQSNFLADALFLDTVSPLVYMWTTSNPILVNTDAYTLT